MNAINIKRKAWALLAYTVADDKGGGSSIDAPVKEELKAICDGADFGQVSIAAQADFKRTSARSEPTPCASTEENSASPTA